MVIFMGLVSLAMALFVPPAFFVECPFYDDWSLVPIVNKVLEGTVRVQDYWALHNESRLFFPNLILSHWAAWTSWDMRIVPWAHMALLGAAAWMLSRLKFKKKSFKEIVTSKELWVVLIFVFSLRTLQTIVWPIHIAVLMATCPTIIGICLVSRNPESILRWVVAGSLAVFSSFSFASGVFFWFAVIPVFWAVRKHRLFWHILAGWLLTAGLVIAIYFYHYERPALHPQVISFLRFPWRTVYFFCVYLGSIFSSFLLSDQAVAGLGLLGVALAGRYFFTLLTTDKREDPKYLGLASVLIYVLFTACTTSVSRAAFGIPTALSERYVTHTCFFWATLGLILLESRSKVQQAMLIALLFVACTSSIFQSLVLASWRTGLEDQVRLYKQEPMNMKEIRKLYLYPDVIEQSVMILKNKKLSLFNPALAPKETGE